MSDSENIPISRTAMFIHSIVKSQALVTSHKALQKFCKRGIKRGIKYGIKPQQEEHLSYHTWLSAAERPNIPGASIPSTPFP